MGTQPAPAKETLETSVLQFRIEGIRESAKRARLAFLASTIGSLCIIIAEYNAYYSWYFWRVSLTPQAEQTERFKDLVALYVQNPVINVSLLGIRIGEGDLVVLGSLALLGFSIWLNSSMETYTRLVDGLLGDTKGSSKDVKRLVFSGIYSFLVFSTVTLSGVLSEKEWSARWLQRTTVTVLYTLPVVAVCFVLLTDVVSLFFLPAPFTVDIEQSWWHKRLWWHLTTGLRIIAGTFVLIGCVILKYVRNVYGETIGLDRSTASNIRQYASQLARSSEIS